MNVNLDVMERDAARQRGKRPFGFTDLSRGKGLQEVIDFIVENGGLRVPQARRSRRKSPSPCGEGLGVGVVEEGRRHP